MNDYRVCTLRENDPRGQIGPFTKLALLAWAAALVVISVRSIHLTHRATTFDVYIDAGRHWRNGLPIYTQTNGMGFVYSPLIAAYFAAYSWLPLWIGKVAWLATSVALLVGGAHAVMREGIFRVTSDKARALMFLLLLALSLAGLDVAQANSLLIGLLLVATALAMREKWTLCVIAICIAAYLKIYPIVFGFLLCVYAPKKVIPRLFLTMLAFGALSLVLQQPHYVLTQYHDWIATRGADDRRLYSMRHAPLDLWYLLVRIGHLPVSEHAYVALQVLCGGAIAAFSYFSSRWPRERRLAGIFLLCCCWMILLGPATESYTYAILAPAVSLGLVVAFSEAMPPAPMALIALTTLMLLLAQLKSSFFSDWHSAIFNGMRPMAAVFLTVFVILWLRIDAMWKAPETTPA